MAGLLEPIKITEKLTLRNRIVMPPMAREKADPAGLVTPELIRHYQERAQDLGLMIIEHSFVHPSGRYSENQLASDRDECIEGLFRLTDAVHAHNTPLILQLSHAGPRTSSKVLGHPPLSAWDIPDNDGETPEAVSNESIDLFTEAFTNAALRAKKAGFDGVEIHSAHGFLLNTFLSPLSNQRPDEYGGSLENRSKFLLNVFKAVKETVGDLPVLVRLGAEDAMPDGFTLGDGKQVAQWLQELGAAIIDVSGGLCGSRPEGFIGPGFFMPLAAGIKEVVNIPVIGVGGIKDPTDADRFVKEEYCDLVAVGRAYLANPHWATDALAALA